MGIKIYCVGLFRTGTNTVYEMFRRSYAAEHEFMLGPAIQAVSQHAMHPGNGDAIASFVARRDLAASLVLDSSGANYLFVPHFRKIHPNAKFILTVRDCYSWLNSTIGTIYRSRNRAESAALGRFANSLEMAGDGTMRWTDRSELKYCVAQLARTWASANSYLLNSVPAELLLTVETHKLGESVGLISRFAGVPKSSLDAHHANGGGGIDYLACFDAEEIEHVVRTIGGPLMHSHFAACDRWSPPQRDADRPPPDPLSVRRLFSVLDFELLEE